MSLWNPYGFTIGGAPALLGAAPPALRVMGGQATAEQIAAARMAFNRFCAVARTSPVPNPTEIGRLPDGTPYRIVVVGPQTFMEIWPTGQDEKRISGIAVRLTYLDGSLLPGHTTDEGEPTIYLLTPRTKKNARAATGEWDVRTLDKVQGGKAVNANVTGKLYYAGIPGKPSAYIPLDRLGYDINGLAYRDDATGGGGTVWRNLKPAGRRSPGSYSPLPFVYTERAAGGATKSLAMSLDVSLELDELARLRYRLKLYVGEIQTGSEGDIGALVWEQRLDDLSIDPNGITFSDDGHEARTTGSLGGSYVTVTLRINKTGVTISTQAHAGQTEYSGVRDNYVEDVKQSGGGGVTIREVTVQGGYSGPGADGPTTDIPPTALTHPFNDFGPGEYVKVQRLPEGHAFDRRGQPYDPGKVLRTVHSSNHGGYYEYRYGFSSPDGEYQFVETTRTGQSTILVTVNDVLGSRVVHRVDEQYQYRFTFTREGQEVSNTTVASGSRTIYDDSEFGRLGGRSFIFQDHMFGFGVFYETGSTRAREDAYVVAPDGKTPHWATGPSTITSYSKFGIALKSGEELVGYEFDLSGQYRHVVIAAADPMTGCLLVNVQEVHQETRRARKSWIFLVDDTGAKPLHAVMDIPTGTDVCVRDNSDLISV